MNSTRKYRLAESTLIEPLVNSWHAWTYLITPVPASLHLVHYQIPTMESYLSNPDTHAEAYRDPALICGPFIGIPPERAQEVGDLLENTKRKQSGLLRLAKAVREFHDWIVREAKGQSLEPYYQKAPEELRGYIELIYDYYNRPTVRFLEGMLYQSDYYDPGLQSLRLSRLVDEGSRTFFISTPRVLNRGEIDWTVPFADPRIDELYRLDFEPQPVAYIRELLGLSAAEDEHLLPLLTEQPAPDQETGNGTKPRIRYIGHACVLIEWQGMTILTDPFVPVMPVEGGISRLTFHDLPRKIDYVLITHNHQDHFSLESLLRLRHRIGCLVVPRTFGISYGDVSLKLLMQTLGFNNVREMDTFETIALPDGEIVALPFLGEHGDLPHGKTAYMVRAGGERIMFGADSDCLERRMYDIVRQKWGRIDTVFLGTEHIGAPLDWVYGPMLEEPLPQYKKTRRQHGCDASAALNILEAVGAKRIYNYAMGLEPWMEYMLGLGLHDESPQIIESDKLLAKARGRGLLTAERTCGTMEVQLDHAPALAYWQLQLGGTLPSLDLNPGRKLQPMAGQERGRHVFTLSAQSSLALKKLSQRENVSLSTTLSAAFQALLHLYTGQEDIVVWTPIKNREQRELEPLVGLFANTLALRTDFSGEPTFRTLMRRVDDVLTTAHTHGPVPFEMLQRAMKDQAKNNSSLHCEAMFVFDDVTPKALTLPSLSAPAPKIEGHLTGVDLGFFVSEDDQNIGGSVEYRTDLYDEHFIVSMLENYQTLLTEVAADPSRVLADIPLGHDGVLSLSDGINDAEVEFQF
jgi:L-ascorbate metabolism protein UlaG (beta-lactamase superfamily)